MKTVIQHVGIIVLSLTLGMFLSACSKEHTDHGHQSDHAEVAKGPHGGRLLMDGDFAIELSIFETGVPPEFRAWATKGGQLLKPTDVELNIKLTRLGNKIDDINFKPHGDALRGDMEIYEPHSFIVTINAKHDGATHSWQYDNFEGRTKIEKAVAAALAIETSIAGPVVLQETVRVFGQVMANAERVRDIHARFDGVIKSVALSMGSKVEKGQTLATIESNESLKLYSIKAPISGVITHRNANPGEQSEGRTLFTITDPSSVWVDLSIFPADQKRVRVGAPVSVKTTASEQYANGTIATINVIAEANQSVKARLVLDNKEGSFVPGSFVQAQIKVAEHPVALAVKRTGLQAFRDFTVVYAQIGDEYEVRMLELGKQDDEWIEVLGGLEAGTHYVSENSYVIKADIEKSGAAHDH